MVIKYKEIVVDIHRLKRRRILLIDLKVRLIMLRINREILIKIRFLVKIELLYRIRRKVKRKSKVVREV